MEATQKTWFEKEQSAVLMLLLFFPVGIYMLWKHKHFSDGVRWGLSVGVPLLVFMTGGGAYLLLLIGAVIYFLKNKTELQSAKVQQAQETAADIERAEWLALGATPEERERNIEKLFDEKDHLMRVTVRWDLKVRWRDNQGNISKWPGYVAFQITRSLAMMEAREREFLRMVYDLHNREMLSDSQWLYYKFAFVNGDGKAGINSWSYQLYDEDLSVKDGPSLIKFYQGRHDASVDSAVNFLLQDIRQYQGQHPEDKFVAGLTERLKGGGVWLTARDMPGSLFAAKDSEYKLKLGNLADGDVEVTYTGEGSIMTIAPPGSGKTQCFVLPNLLHWKGAAVVLDVKGEIYAATSKWRAANVGPVYKFSPLDPSSSHCYNPLVFVRQDPEYLWEDSRFLADMMLVPSGGSDPFWENMARDVLTSAIAYIAYQNAPSDRAISRLMDLLYGIEWDVMVASLKSNMEVQAMRQMGHSLGEMEKKTRDSVLKTAQSSLSAWQGERIKKTTLRSDWNPVDLRNSKATVYICINPNEIDSYLSVLRVFIAQHIRMMTAELPARDAAPVLFVLDELPRLKKMPPVDEALNIGRQYGIRLWMFTQSYGQLKEAYPNAEGMLGSCTVRIFMNVPLNDELAQNLSDQLGYREGPLDSTRVKLLEPIELAGPNFKDIALVLASNTKPMKVRKVFAWQDPELQQRMNLGMLDGPELAR